MLPIREFKHPARDCGEGGLPNEKKLIWKYSLDWIKLYQMKNITRTLLIVAGTLCVVLGIVGMILPVLPTTPFLLLAALCYARSSDRFYHWLLTNRWFGEYIKNYREGRGIPRKQKVLTILLLWLTIGSTVGFSGIAVWLKVILVVIAISVTIHLVKIRTFIPEPDRPELPQESQPLAPERSDV